jgi:hypothetical protein
MGIDATSGPVRSVEEETQNERSHFLGGAKMWRGNHAAITRAALKLEGLRADTVDFICAANRDSDDDARTKGGQHYEPQHFQIFGEKDSTE